MWAWVMSISATAVRLLTCGGSWGGESTSEGGFEEPEGGLGDDNDDEFGESVY